jgi:hypothetical protein
VTPRAAIFLLFWLVFNGRIVLACSCARLGPLPCGKSSPTSVAFVGTVESVENPPPDPGQAAESSVDMRTLDQSGYSRYHFRVDENFSGTQATDIDVFSGRGGGDCSYHFQKGERYMVFPYKSDDGRLMATICSETRPVELAQPMLAVLRAMRDHQPVASLYGSMRSVEQPYGSVSDDYYGKPVADTRMILRSDKNTLEAKTDANGNYAFFGVPAGKYHVEADLPQHFEIAHTILSEPVPPIDLPQNACYEYNVEVLPTGRIRGKVIGPDGNALPYASVELYRPSRYPGDGRSFGWSESQDLKKPEFVFEHVAAGDYILVYNDQERIEPITPYPRMFYPGVKELKQAQIIHVEEGQEISGLEFGVSGGRATRAITVRLLAPNGELPDINYVEANGNDGSSLSEQELSPGVFRIMLFPGIRYEMQGAGYCSATHKESKTPVGVVHGSETGSNELALTFPGPGCPKKPDSREDNDGH